jgi:Protein of unknown function (DUF1348)
MNTSTNIIQRPPLPPFTREKAIEKVRLAENGWNSRAPEKVALAGGAIERSLYKAGLPSSTFSPANGGRSWIIV